MYEYLNFYVYKYFFFILEGIQSVTIVKSYIGRSVKRYIMEKF